MVHKNKQTNPPTYTNTNGTALENINPSIFSRGPPPISHPSPIHPQFSLALSSLPPSNRSIMAAPSNEKDMSNSNSNSNANAEDESPPSPPPPETSRSGESEQGERGGWTLPLRQQVVGACRADERLMPLLTLNFSCGPAEDRFISHLSQHFEVSEVGMLARCLCVPLLSLRVGKVQRHGSLLCPTSARGKLSLGLLPSSNMRITFAGDDGHTEQLALLTNDFEGSEVMIEELSADNSGRSFLLRISESKVFYYWCAEKSKVHGVELLGKMKDLLEGRPSLSDLTGISNSRLDAFATHLHAYLLASSIGDAKSMASLNDFLSLSSTHDQYLQPPSIISKSSRFRTSAANATKASSVYQASLSPRSGTFKDGAPRTSCIRSVVREKLKRRGEFQLSPSAAPVDPIPSTSKNVNQDLTSEKCEGDCSKNSGTSGPLHLPDLFPSLPSLYPLATQCALPEGTASDSLFKPYYCWCPPCPSSLQYNVTPLHLPVTSVEPLPLPPLSSLLSNEQPPVSAVSVKLDTSDLPSLTLPAILHDPLLHLPLPSSSLVPLHGSQVPTFTPLMSDPIVHVPVIDMCSSGQAYLVSAGPSISSTVPLLPSLKPLIPEKESLVERSARETLMRLIASTPPISSPQLINILPAVLTDAAENISRASHVNKQVDVHPSDKLFGTSCVDVIGRGIAALEMHLEDEVCIGDDGSAALVEEYEYVNGDCDRQHPQRKV